MSKTIIFGSPESIRRNRVFEDKCECHAFFTTARMQSGDIIMFDWVNAGCGIWDANKNIFLYEGDNGNYYKSSIPYNLVATDFFKTGDSKYPFAVSVENLIHSNEN